MSFQREHQPTPMVAKTPRRVERKRTTRSALPSEESIEQDDSPYHHMAVSRFVTVEKAASITGLTAKAIRRKIEDGVWLEHRVWKRGPDGRIYIDIKGYTQWVTAWQQ